MQALTSSLIVLALVSTADAQVRGSNVPPIVIQPGQVAKLTWRPAPPHPNVAMCCGGALQLSWSPMDSGVVSSVALNIDDSCPNELQNQQFVEYIFQAQPKGLVTLDFKQNGDYYISCSVGQHCSEQGMRFLLAVRGCPQDNPTYTPVVPLNLQCRPQQQQLGMNRTMGMSQQGMPGTLGMGAGNPMAAQPGLPSRQQKATSAAGVSLARSAGLLAAAVGGIAAASFLL
eukprot:gene13151-13281_t